MSSAEECSVCFELFNDSRILPCGHTFCLQCLQQQLSDNAASQSATLACSLCREIYSVPNGGLAALPKNYSIESVIEQKRAHRQRQEQELKCDQHGNKLFAYCRLCNTSACPKCLLTHQNHADDENIVDIATANKEFNAVLQYNIRSAKIAESNVSKQLNELKLVNMQVEEHKISLKSKIEREMFDTKQILKCAYEKLVQAVDDCGSKWSSNIGNEVVSDCQQLEMHVRDKEEIISKCEHMLSNSSLAAKANLIRTISVDNSLSLPLISKISASNIMQQLTDAAAAACMKVAFKTIQNLPLVIPTLLERLDVAVEQQSDLPFRILCVSNTKIVFVVNDNELHCYDKASKQVHLCVYSHEKIFDAVITHTNIIVCITPVHAISMLLNGTINHTTSVVNPCGLYINGDNVILLAANNRIYRSNNDGFSWGVVCESPDKTVRLLQAVRVKGFFELCILDTYWVVELQQADGTCKLCEYGFEIGSKGTCVARKQIMDKAASYMTASSRLAYDENDCVLVTHFESNSIDVYSVRNRSFLSRVSTKSAGKEVALKVVALNSKYFSAYACRLSSSKQLYDIREFRFSSSPGTDVFVLGLLPANDAASEPAVTSQGRCVVSSNCSTVLLGVGNTVKIYTDIVKSCFHCFTVRKEIVSAVIARNETVVCIMTDNTVSQLSFKGDVLKQRSFTTPRSVSVAVNGDIILLTAVNTVCRSADGGRNWTKHLELLTSSDFIYQALEIRNTQDEVVYWTVERNAPVSYCLSEYICKPSNTNSSQFMSTFNITRRVIDCTVGRVTDKSRLTLFTHGHVLLTDHDHHVVHAYSADGQYKCEVVSECEGVHHPSDVVYDCGSEVLYVVNNTHRQVLVFSISQPVAKRTVYELRLTI